MPEPKRGHACRPAGKRHRSLATTQPLKCARLTLHDTDPITDNEDTLYTLFYEYYRGYTIYSNTQGVCCIHGQQGCFRLQGQFVSFPDVEDAKNAIKSFREQGWQAQQSMDRTMGKGAYVCLNELFSV